MRGCYRLMLLAAIVVGLAGRCAAIEQIEHSESETRQAWQWDVLDIRFQVDQLPEQPEDVDFSAKFESSKGKRLQLPGFYNGGKEYVIRFTPPTADNWNYVTSSSATSLENQSGQLAVQAARQNRRGGIVADKQAPRKFRYKNGERYYPIAFESDWLFALDAENPTDIPVTRKFVDTLAQSGFNQIVMNVFAYDVNWKKDKRLLAEHEYGSPRVFPFGGNNTEPDHSRLNIEYFQRLDRVIDYLDQRDIAAHLMIYVWNKRVNWPEANSDADNRYFDYVVKRYQAFPNLVWDISKEALGYGHNDVNYITQRIERLRKLDAYDRLVTVHAYGYCKQFPQHVDFISVQLWSAELYSVMRKVYGEFPDQPILNIEHGGYEASPYVVFPGSYTSPEYCLERAYQCVFAGTYPTHYWQGAAWNVVIPDIEAMKPEDRPRLDYYRHMRTLVEKYNLGELQAGEPKSNSGFCLHNGKDLYVYYVPKETISIGPSLPKKFRGLQMACTWFDPFTGEFAEPIEQKIEQWPRLFKPAGERLAILIVEIQPEVEN